jgi:hypothetical protein
MKRGRPRLEKAPPLDGPIPERLRFLEECRYSFFVIKDGGDTPSDPEFILDLLERYIELADKPLNSPEVAAMVDWKAARLPSIAQAYEWVSEYTGKSIEAVRQDHWRYGEKNHEISLKREEYLRGLDEQSDTLNSITEEEHAAVMEDMRVRLEEEMRQKIQKAEDEIRKAKEIYAEWAESLAEQHERLFPQKGG